MANAIRSSGLRSARRLVSDSCVTMRETKDELLLAMLVLGRLRWWWSAAC